MSFVSLYLYVPDEGSLLPKYRDCTTSNDFESYIYIYIYIYITVTHLRRIRKVLGSTPGECQFFQLFRCFLSSVLPLRSVGRSNFDKGRHNSNNYVDSKSAYN